MRIWFVYRLAMTISRRWPLRWALVDRLLSLDWWLERRGLS